MNRGVSTVAGLNLGFESIEVVSYRACRVTNHHQVLKS